MPTPTFCCGFECGVSSTTAHWFNTVNAFSTVVVRSGARSLRANPAAQVTSSLLNDPFFLNIFVVRAYVYFATLPDSNIYIIVGDGTFFSGCWFNQSDSKIYARANVTNGSTGFTVTTGVWYLVECRINKSANPWLVDVQVNGTALGQASEASAAEPSTLHVLASFDLSTDTWTGDVYMDDVLISNTSADYPLGAGKVEHFIPTSDGTHTATTTTIVKGTIATPVGGNVAGSTDVFNWVNAVPLLGGATDNTRLVNQQTTASTLYAEEIFGPAPGISTPTVAPRSVEVITAERQAGTQSGGFAVKLNDNGTENAVVTRSRAGATTDRYGRKHYALSPTGGPWTVISGAGNFNNIRARFGYSADAAPDQYWRGIMIEAEFATTVANTGLLPFCISPQGTR